MKKIFLPTIILLLGITTFNCRKKDNPIVEETGSLLSFTIEAQKNSALLSSDLRGIINSNKIDLILDKKIDLKQVVITVGFTGEGVYINNNRIDDSAIKVDIQNGTAVEVRSKNGRVLIYYVSFVGNIDLPKISITTENNAPIVSKTTYLKGNMAIDGKNSFANYNGSLQIRGRGNTTWSYAKKPYRLKLDTKASLFGLPSAKDWVLLANYLDGTHTLNAVGMKVGQLLKIPFTNTIIPVELTINGEYLGLYMLTEQIEVQPNRVNIGNDGLLFLMDSYYDEEWKFKSANYQLPMMIKNPDLTHDSQITPIKAEFERFESLIANTNFPNNNYLNEIDENSIVDYFLTYMLTDNKEYNHPKSTYLYKTKTGKFNLGPIWDFDWAFGYKSPNQFTTSTNDPFLIGTSLSLGGTPFFARFATDPRIKTLLRQRWADFNATKMKELLAYIDEYAFTIEAARQRDYQKWGRGNADFKSEMIRLKSWLQNRASFLTGYINSL